MKSPDDLELYIGGITNRYAAYTGDVISDSPITYISVSYAAFRRD